MERREFLQAAVVTGAVASGALATTAAANGHGEIASGAIWAGSPVVFGPAPDALCVVQPVRGPASGYLEMAVDGEGYRRIDAETAGLLPYERFALKFRLPAVRPGGRVRYRLVARPIEFKTAYEIQSGPPQSSQDFELRALDPGAEQTRFVIWNDTHENLATLESLHKQTAASQPDFLVWNGDQTNDIDSPEKMSEQILAPGGLEIAARWPLAYARGNHDVRGPAARQLASFTGTPDDRFYYAFRSGPLAALVLDTGEDKPDDHPVFAGLAAFERFRARQTEWLQRTLREPWFSEARWKVLFCHIPLWWTDEVTDIGFWRYSRVCRDAWLPWLSAAGVQVVVSGHTHEFAWLPAGASRPIGQLIGGGPRPQHATLIEGTADRAALTLLMKRLNGTVIERVQFTA